MGLSGHLGSRVSDLVDGRLGPEQEDRLWTHVLGCAGCRRRVEQEGWAKRQLGGLAGPSSPPPSSLVGALYDVDAWSQVDRIEDRSRRRRAGTLLVGGGAAGAAVLGLLTVAGPVVARDAPRPAAHLRGSQPGLGSTAHLAGNLLAPHRAVPAPASERTTLARLPRRTN